MIKERKSKQAYEWWTSLNQDGLLIAAERLPEFFPEETEELSFYMSDLLRRSIDKIKEEPEYIYAFMDIILEKLLGYPPSEWKKGNEVDSSWTVKSITKVNIKPVRIWQGPHGNILPVFNAYSLMGMRGGAKETFRLGIGRGRRAAARVIEWLRKKKMKIALLTNGRQWRLIYAGIDFESWCEWDIDMWFEEGQASDQVTALRILLGRDSLCAPEEDEPSLLSAAIQETRKGQSQLSTVLGERVRQAVEILIDVSSNALDPLDSETLHHVSRRDIYIAAVRMIMRLVVVLFAEARDLLPRYNDIYNNSYGLSGLREQLMKTAGGSAFSRLNNSWSAWSRIMSLFRLIYFGSAHEKLNIRAYGGDLFKPGRMNSDDPVSRAVYAFESTENIPSDYDVMRILELLSRSKVKVRRGRSSTYVNTAVNFSDLSPEYIGILYEGLLDFELKRAPENEPMVFLNIGDQPVLPFLRLDAMNSKDIKKLLEKLKKSSKDSSDDAEIIDEIEEDITDDEKSSDDEQAAEDEEDNDDISHDDRRRTAVEWVYTWAERAVKEARIVKYPRKDASVAAREQFNKDVKAEAKKLIKRIVFPGEWFLVRWGNVRKGSGTFYTRPKLAWPTVQRTLEPLVHEKYETDAHKSGTDNNTKLKKPEEILNIKVCDPAMGSGSFLISALRFLTTALKDSLHEHDRIRKGPENTIYRLADGALSTDPSEETLPVPPDHEEFDKRLEAVLKRHVVEQCIYGVDIDPVAVLLAKSALWIDTMDRNLPFEFLDHKLKCGNSLVGCRFDLFQDYPVMAWERDGGDQNHNRFVNHFYEKETKDGKLILKGDLWTSKIKTIRNTIIKSEIKEVIEGKEASLLPLLEKGQDLEKIHADMLEKLIEIHKVPVHQNDMKEQKFREEILEDPRFIALKQAFDTWCSIWFWPGDELEVVPTPKNFLDPPEQTKKIVDALRNKHRFFHWELEFPDVFNGSQSGFHAVVGNPPWDIQKPKSQEFFSNIDPLYRSYGKQEALKRQETLFQSAMKNEKEWLDYNAVFRSMSNWTKYVAYPFGDPDEKSDNFSMTRSTKENVRIHEIWRSRREKRVSFSGGEHPFRHQGSADINTYKLFLESSYSLIKNGGLLGMLVPSGLYSDKGTMALRDLFVDSGNWLWLFGFENREGIFDIHRSFKFCPVIVQKGARTEEIKTAFMRRSLDDWVEAEKHVTLYPKEQVEQFSPHSKSLLEIQSERDLEILKKIYDNGILLGDDSPEGWGIKYAREFDMTNDSKMFHPRPEMEKQGYLPDEYGHWLKGGWKPYDGPESILKRPKDLILSVDGKKAINIDHIEDIALPLYEGRMIGQFDFSQKGWVSGKGRKAVWRNIPFFEKVIEPQYLINTINLLKVRKKKSINNIINRFCFMGVSSSTNSRTMISSFIDFLPCGNSVPILTSKFEIFKILCCTNSFVYDYVIRRKCSGLNLNYFVIEDTPLFYRKNEIKFDEYALALNCSHNRFASYWLNFFSSRDFAWKKKWAVTNHERLRMRVINDILTAYVFNLSYEDFKWIIGECDKNKIFLKDEQKTKKLNPKGFWRADKDKDPELRHTVLSLVAFHDLKQKGLKAFLEQNDGEGWMIPETLRLADYGLGRDDRAKEHQPVRLRLGPRFLPWQLEQTPEESWEECERHAELINRIMPPPEDDKPVEKSKRRPTDLFGNPVQTDLFGNIIYPGKRRR